MSKHHEGVVYDPPTDDLPYLAVVLDSQKMITAIKPCDTQREARLFLNEIFKLETIRERALSRDGGMDIATDSPSP